MIFRRLDQLPLVLTGEWRELLPALQPLRDAVRRAQRVIFARSAAEACHDLATDCAALDRARPQIFAPFAETWIEFEGMPDLAMLWHSWPEDDHQRGDLKIISWPKAGPVPLMHDFEADIANLDRPPFVLREENKRSLIEAAQESSGPIADGHDGYILDPAHRDEWAAAPALAAFALLASKGMTESHGHDMTRLNKQRAKAGNYPLMGYTEIRLNIDAPAAAKRYPDMGHRTGTMPEHQVRAHLRLIPSGRVVIVRAHTRGNPEHGVKRSHYTVMRDEDRL